MFLVEKFVSTRPIYVITPATPEEEHLFDAMVASYEAFKEAYSYQLPTVSLEDAEDLGLNDFLHKVSSKMQQQVKDRQQQKNGEQDSC